MTRKEEADTLRTFNGETYFSQFFGESDIEQMAQNVENDFPIELNCTFNKKVEALNQEIVKLKEKHKQEIIAICQKLIKNIDAGNDEDIVYQIAEDAIGKDAIIKYKHQEKLDFSDKELDYLVSKI